LAIDVQMTIDTPGLMLLTYNNNFHTVDFLPRY